MIKALIVLRLKDLGDKLLRRTRGGGKTKAMRMLVALLAVYCVVVFLGLFGGLFYLLCEPFASMGLSWLYFALAGIIATMLCFFGTIFLAQSLIFESKDNELLLSMPIKPSAILFSRVGTLFLVNLGSSLIITLPCIVVWFWQRGFDALLMLRWIVVMVVLPLLPTALLCVIGFVIALISSRTRSKNAVTMLLTGGTLAAYFYVCFNSQQLLAKLLQNGEKLAAAIEKVLPPFYALGVGVFEGGAAQCAMLLLWCIVPMAAAYALLSHGFISVVTMKRGAKKVAYKGQKMQRASARKAMTIKEVRRYTANAMYLFNGAVGAAMALILSVALLFKQDLIEMILSMYSLTGVDLNVWMGGVACAMLCLMAGMNMLSAASISIEGKNLWLMQSLPLKAGDILLPKALAHMVICLPILLAAGIVMGVALKADVITAAALIVLPLLVCAFIALFGVTINLVLSRFDYTNDVIAIKQSMASGITLFSGMGIVALPVILYTVVFKASFALGYLYLVCGVLLALLCLVLYYYLSRSAQKRFDALGQG
ncbi:MAG: hypothetical protein IJA59_00685 [Clostridia bacterium]|nr:hypothetical protein [Clostridia bacterium]